MRRPIVLVGTRIFPLRSHRGEEPFDAWEGPDDIDLGDFIVEEPNSTGVEEFLARQVETWSGLPSLSSTAESTLGADLSSANAEVEADASTVIGAPTTKIVRPTDETVIDWWAEPDGWSPPKEGPSK